MKYNGRAVEWARGHSTWQAAVGYTCDACLQTGFHAVCTRKCATDSSCQVGLGGIHDVLHSMASRELEWVNSRNWVDWPEGMLTAGTDWSSESWA